jgi:hypothetical protein
VVGRDKVKLTILLSLMLNGFIAFFTVPTFSSVGVHWSIPIILQLIIFFIIGLFVIRIFEFKEDEKIREYEGYNSDSFSKFFYLRNISSGDQIQITSEESIPVFEFSNGSNMVILKFRFGSNNDIKSARTRKAMEKIFRLLGNYNLEYRTTTSSEKFSTSPEATSYIEKLRKIPDKKLARPLLDIVQAALDYSEDVSIVNIMHLQIRTKSNYQRYELGTVFQDIKRILKEGPTCFRSTDYMNVEEFIEYLREFYGLEAIDLSILRARDGADLDNSTKDIVNVYKVVAMNGRSRTVVDDDFAKSVEVGVKINRRD